jgi:hypothetical protein
MRDSRRCKRCGEAQKRAMDRAGLRDFHEKMMELRKVIRRQGYNIAHPFERISREEAVSTQSYRE